MTEDAALTPTGTAGKTGALIRIAAAFSIVAALLLLTPHSVRAQGYGGPSLLSRGGNSPGKRGRAPVDFRVYGAVRGSYESGLITAQLTDTGELNSLDIKGVQVELGAYGAKNWRRSSLGLDYRGDYRKTTFDLYDGSNQALSLDWQSQITNRVSYFLRQTGGTTNRAFGGFSAPAFVDQNNLGVPLNEVYDSRVYFAQTSAGIAYRQSARNTLRLSGDGFVIRRTSRALVGMQGYRAGADFVRQVTRSTLIGAGYGYLKFEFPRVYGASEIHMVHGILDRRINRNLNLKAQLGVFRADTTGTQRIVLSPEIAAILGRTTGVEAFQRISLSPQIMISVNYTLERGSFSAALNSGVNPGNGVYLTSRADSISGGYSYAGIRRLSLGLSAGYTRTNSIGLILGDLTSVQGGGGMTYKLSEYLSLSVQADRRRFTSPAVAGRNGSSISAGLSFAPGRLPLSIW
ncbi:MAG TPA: hypothetical protein VER03_13410 [Bryobacteraceae bacterium]|nr:hypothetical protein [Bryobacteraceae bacterium]